MVDHVPNHSSKPQLHQNRTLRRHSSKKHSYFGDMLMSKTLSKSQLCLRHSQSHKYALDTL